MCNCFVNFSVANGEQVYAYQVQGKINKTDKLCKVSFSLNGESNLSYAFSILSNKVMLSTRGDFCYCFCLEQGRVFKFVIDVMNKPVNCSVDCKALCVKISEGEVLVESTYALDFGGNESVNRIKLTVKESL